MKVNDLYITTDTKEKIRIFSINEKEKEVYFLIFDKKINGKQTYIVNSISIDIFKKCLAEKSIIKL